jgi:hypothetical protein
MIISIQFSNYHDRQWDRYWKGIDDMQSSISKHNRKNPGIRWLNVTFSSNAYNLYIKEETGGGRENTD